MQWRDAAEAPAANKVSVVPPVYLRNVLRVTISASLHVRPVKVDCFRRNSGLQPGYGNKAFSAVI